MKMLRHTCVATLIFISLAVGGCKTGPESEPTKKPATTAKQKPPPTTLKDQNGDQAFQSFIGRLRLVVAAHDADTLASMMTPDFGYVLDPPREGSGVFAYWDEHNLWPELQMVIRERFVPFGSKEDAYMVAPSEFATDPANYSSYRAGIHLVNGSWKFAYFVNGQ